MQKKLLLHKHVMSSEVENGAAGEAATWTGRPKAERTGSERITSRGMIRRISYGILRLRCASLRLTTGANALSVKLRRSHAPLQRSRRGDRSTIYHHQLRARRRSGTRPWAASTSRRGCRPWGRARYGCRSCCRGSCRSSCSSSRSCGCSCCG